MPARRPVLAILGALAILSAPLAAISVMPQSAAAEAAGTPSGPAAVGGYLDLGPGDACAVQQDRAVRCWGSGTTGRLGGGDVSDRLATSGTSATTVPLGSVTAVAAGDLHSCALISNGDVRCWGSGASGQLASGNRDTRLDGTVDPLSGTDDASTARLGGPASAIAAGSEYSCALMAGTGAVRCWGDGRFGKLGSGNTDKRLDGLVDPASGTDDASTVALGGAATAITAGAEHACAIVSGGAVRCWGEGLNGRLGSGATDDRLDGAVDATTHTDDPSTVSLPAAATAISAGDRHTCALLATGDVACWGYGKDGQLGTGRTDDRLDGKLSNSGQTNTPTDAAAIVPLKPIGTAAKLVATTPNIPAVAIAAGDLHTCAILNTGDVRCWGEGASGQLGQGATDNRLDGSWNNPTDAATRVGGGPNGTGPGLGAPAIAITAGVAATCAELSNGAVRCWGDGTSGQLGSSASDPRLDGVVDPATGTDDASIVPIGALPTTYLGDTPVPVVGPAPPAASTTAPSTSPAPTNPAAQAAPAATPATAVALAFSVKLNGRMAKIAALVTPSKAGTCPKSVKAQAKQGKAAVGKATLALKKSGAMCRAAGTLRLSSRAAKGKRLAILISGKGIRSRTLTAKA